MQTISCGKYTATLQLTTSDYYIDHGIFEEGQLWHQSIFSPGSNTHVVVARDRHGLAALWKFSWIETSDKHHWLQRRIKSYFTWVSPRWRNQGLAFKMWSTGIEQLKPLTIYVETCSDRGYSLVQKIKEHFPDITLKHDECGSRKLRDIRKSLRSPTAEAAV